MKRELQTVLPEGVFEGYASLFETPDLAGDVITRGAFRDSLRRRGPLGVKLLFQHDPSQPVGVWEELREDDLGLYVRGRLILGSTRGRDIACLIREGAIDGLSIGFRTEKDRQDAKTGGRRIDRVDLWEISVVTFPLLPEARIGLIKAGLRLPRPAAARKNVKTPA